MKCIGYHWVPTSLFKVYEAYDNGFRFHTRNRKLYRKPRGEVLMASQNGSYSTSKNRRPIYGNVDYLWSGK